MPKLLTTSVTCTCPHGGSIEFNSSMQVKGSSNDYLSLSEFLQGTIKCSNPAISGGPCPGIISAIDPSGLSFTISGEQAVTKNVVALTPFGPVKVDDSHGGSKIEIQSAPGAEARAIFSQESCIAHIKNETAPVTDSEKEPSKTIKNMFWRRNHDVIGETALNEKIDIVVEVKGFKKETLVQFEIYQYKESGPHASVKRFKSTVQVTRYRKDGGKDIPVLEATAKWVVKSTQEIDLNDNNLPCFFTVARVENVEMKSPLLYLRRLRDGFHFLPLIGISWIPFKPLADGVLNLALRLDKADGKKSGDEGRIIPDKLNFTFSDYMKHIAGYKGTILDADSAFLYFDMIRTNPRLPSQDKQEFFNLMPLAISANTAPGMNSDQLEKEAPADSIDIETTFDSGLGEYRGYFHFVPWVQVKQGRIVKYGIEGEKQFQSNNLGPEGLTGEMAFDLTVPSSSSSITPIPDDSWPSQYGDWEDVLGGYSLYLENPGSEPESIKALLTGGKAISSWALESIVPFVSNTLFSISAKNMRASGRGVKYELAEPNINWRPEKQHLTTPNGVIQSCFFDFRHGGRVAPTGQKLAEKINGKSVPWICLAANVRFSEHEIELRIGGAQFPDHAIYIGVSSSSSAPMVLFALDHQDMTKQLHHITQAKKVFFSEKNASNATEFIDLEHGANLLSEEPNTFFGAESIFKSKKSRNQGGQSDITDLSVAYGDLDTVIIDVEVINS
jgi:hypothetical protein